jgi:hypothetical protein
MVSHEENIKMDLECIEETDFSEFTNEFNGKHYILSTKFDLTRATIQRSKKALFEKLSQDGFEGKLNSTGKFISNLGENVFVIYDSENFSHESADALLEQLDNT